jgi:hypothetical protein
VDQPLTDAQIAGLCAVRKVVVSQSGERQKGAHVEWEFKLEAPNGDRFIVFARQNQKLGDDFSVGLRWVGPGGESVMLARYNGPSHLHINQIEKTRFTGEHHIHRATERYMAAGLDDEGYAEVTKEYQTMREAFARLIADLNVEGARLPAEQLDWTR